MSRFAVTEVALAERCVRQFVLQRDGYRIVEGGAGVGTEVHQLLRDLLSGALRTDAVEAALATEPLDPIALQAAVVESAYSALFPRLAGLAATTRSDELVRVAAIVHALGTFAAALLSRARRAGIAPANALDETFLATERPVTFAAADGTMKLNGIIDAVCRDHETARTLVIELKTGVADELAGTQARLYASMLAVAGEPSVPVAAQFSGDAVVLRTSDAPLLSRAALEGRLLALAAFEDPSRVPPPATDTDNCHRCNVRKACWNRWGSTLPDVEPAAPATPPPPNVPAGVVDEARRLEKVLRAHHLLVVGLDPSKVTLAPNVVRFLARLRHGENLASVRRVAADIQRDMGWAEPPIVSNHGEDVAIIAPRADRQVVPYAEHRGRAWSELELPVGVDIDGRLRTVDLVEAPHMLVAGQTGSGKSVFLESIVLSLFDRNVTPQPQVILVDPKDHEFSALASLPLARPIVTARDDARALFEWLIEDERLRRNALLQAAGAKKRSDLPPEARFPALVVVIDEIASLVAGYSAKEQKAVLGTIQRIAQLTRSVGIHLVVASQRPSAKVLPGDLKANLPVVVAFRLPKAVDSRVVLDEDGAERLLQRGDLLLKREGQVIRAQGLYCDRRDRQAVLSRLRERAP